MIDRLLSCGVIAVIRLPQDVGAQHAAPLQAAATALAAGGIDTIEVTLTTPGALEAIAELASDEGLKGCMVGAGTVLDVKAAREVIARGARFVVSPTFDRFVVRYCNDHHVPCLPGALTPTELLAASRAGASAVKLFPASAVGPRYLREVLAPLPFLRVVPSGGVSLDNAADWIRAGAAAVSVGGALVSGTLVRDQSWGELTARAGARRPRGCRARAARRSARVSRSAGAPRVVAFGELLLRLSPPGEQRLFDSPELQTFFGEAALDALRREGVGTASILRGGARMGLYFVEPGADLRTMRVVYDRAGSALARIDPQSLDWPRVLAGADWFHASGITPALGDGPAAALAGAISCARAQDIPVSFDLNYREALWRDRDPGPLVEPLARQATVLIANPTAVRAVLGIDADDASLAGLGPARELAKRLADRCGVARVALTRREILGPRRHGWSAILYDAATGTLAQSRRHCVDVVDRVGGGDSFAAGLIARLVSGDAPAEALEFAVAASALKLTVPGDFSRASVREVQDLLRA